MASEHDVFYRRYRLQITLRVLLIVGTALLLAYLVGWTPFYEVWVIVAAVFFFQIIALVRYGEKTVRDLTRFLASIRHADFSLRFTDDKRGPLFTYLSEAFTEVTEAFKRVRAEREEQYWYLDHVVQHVEVALLAFRIDGTVEFINAAAKRLLALPHLRRIQDLKPISEALTETLLHRANGEQALIRLEDKGQHRQLAVVTTEFRLGDEIRVLASFQDIRNALEEQEMEAWQKLTRVLTHEIMNSVAPIASLASTAHHLLQKDREEDDPAALQSLNDVREAAHIIEQRSEALIHFVDAYRSFAKIPQPNFTMVSVEALLSSVRRLLAAELEAKAIACVVQVNPEDLHLTADAELIEQVLINVVLNAIQAVEGQDEAHITLRAYPGTDGVAVIQVQDNGPGIPADVQERIFVPFFTTKEEGSGIGLSLSRQIMRLHRGTLTVQSEPGQGALFTLWF